MYNNNISINFSLKPNALKSTLFPQNSISSFIPSLSWDWVKSDDTIYYKFVLKTYTQKYSTILIELKQPSGLGSK